MPRTKRALSSLSFIIRIWLDRDSPDELRGNITRIGNGGDDYQKSITKLKEINEFVNDSLNQEGFKPQVNHPPWQWFKIAKFWLTKRRNNP